MRHLAASKWAAVVLGWSLSTAALAAEVESGKKVFVQCSVCHATDGRNGTGPGLGGLFGRKAGTAPGFRYSRAMKASAIIWNETTLDAYLAAPQKVVPGSVMPFSGVPDSAARKDLISYLATLK
jgi:cytochrome c